MKGRTRSTLVPAALAIALLVPVLRAEERSSVRGSAAGELSTTYRIGPDDVLQISVWKNEALSRVVPVRPDGMISLPLLNDVPAAGMTPLQLRDLLAKKLTEYVPAPEVSVIVTEVRSIKVSVLGQVTKPGRYELKSRTSVLDILAMAGGFTEYAARSRVVILRSEGDATRRIPFNYERATAENGGSLNGYLHPGDIVLVP